MKLFVGNKKHEIVFYFLAIVAILLLQTESVSAINEPPISPQKPGISYYISGIILYLSWPAIALVGYRLRKWRKGFMVGFLFWFSIAVYTIISLYYNPVPDGGIAIFVYLFFAFVGGILGAISGFIGSGRKNV